MPPRAPRRSLVAAVVVAAASALLVTGCSFNPGEAVNRGVEEAIEGATGGDVSLGGELPEGFPEEVPLIDGEIAFAAGAGGAEGWIVQVNATGGDPVADAVAALEAGGFTENLDVGAATGSGEGARVFGDGSWLVIVVGDAESVTYTVTTPVQ